MKHTVLLKNVIIRKANINDAEGIGYVHYHSWNEAYTGLIDQNYLDLRSLKKCIESAKNYPENKYVAIVDEKVIGFSCYSKARDEDLTEVGEIIAIYILKEYYGQGIGKKLMKVCYMELSHYKSVILWVLKTNSHAISFYKHLGFVKDGKEKDLQISTNLKTLEIRMTLDTL